MHGSYYVCTDIYLLVLLGFTAMNNKEDNCGNSAVRYNWYCNDCKRSFDMPVENWNTDNVIDSESLPVCWCPLCASRNISFVSDFNTAQ